MLQWISDSGNLLIYGKLMLIYRIMNLYCKLNKNKYKQPEFGRADFRYSPNFLFSCKKSFRKHLINSHPDCSADLQTGSNSAVVINSVTRTSAGHDGYGFDTGIG